MDSFNTKTVQHTNEQYVNLERGDVRKTQALFPLAFKSPRDRTTNMLYKKCTLHRFRVFQKYA